MTAGDLEQSTRTGTEPRRRRILVVDDDHDTRELVTATLELEGYAVEQAADGLDALIALRCGALPAAIVLDLEMPAMTGWELRDALLRDPALAGIPVLVVSSSPHPVNAARRLPKPFAPERLVAAVRELAGDP